MELILKIQTNDPTSMTDLAVPLAQSLNGSGGLAYLPIPVMDPTSRMAVPQPDHVLVSLQSPEDFLLVHETMRAYMVSDNSRELTLERVNKAVTVSHESLPDEDVLRHELFS